MRRAALVVAVAAAALVAGSLLWWYWLPLHRSAYVYDNDLLLREAPPYPHARLVATRVEGYQPGCDAFICLGPQRTIGYRTELTYAVPGGTSGSDVVRFYVRRLRGWRHADEDPFTLADFERGEAELAVDAQDVDPESASTYTLTADRLGAVQP